MEKELTEAQELFAQKVASGYTQTKAAMLAFPDNQNPRQQGCNTARKDHVKNRIIELKRERAEVASLDIQEQIRRYNELYFMALEKNNLGLAKQMLERIDSIGGFDAPTKSVSLKGTLEDSTKALKGEDLEKDLKKFSNIIGKHHETPQGKSIEEIPYVGKHSESISKEESKSIH